MMILLVLDPDSSTSYRDMSNTRAAASDEFGLDPEVKIYN